MATFTNQASLSYNNTVTTSNVTTGELVEVLSITKTALSATYGPNEKITYVISIVNSGATPFTGLTVSDDLGGYTVGTPGTTVYPLSYDDGSILYYTNGVQQADPVVTAGPPLSITGISVPAGGNATLIYETTATGFAPLALDGSINNTATLSGAGLSAPATAAATVTADTQPILSITKDLTPTSVAENGTLTYTFTIQNLANTAADAADNVTLSDTFDPRLSDLTVTFNGTTWVSPTNYTYDEGSGLFQTVPGQITVPAATFSQDPVTGLYTTTPGISVVRVTGTV